MKLQSWLIWSAMRLECSDLLNIIGGGQQRPGYTIWGAVSAYTFNISVKSIVFIPFIFRCYWSYALLYVQSQRRSPRQPNSAPSSSSASWLFSLAVSSSAQQPLLLPLGKAYRRELLTLPGPYFISVVILPQFFWLGYSSNQTNNKSNFRVFSRRWLVSSFNK